MNEIEKKAYGLIHQTVRDLSDTLYFENDPEVLHLALGLAKNSIGYGSGKTATNLIRAKLKKLEKAKVT